MKIPKPAMKSLKVCTKCGQEKHFSEFSKAGQFILQNSCKVCNAIYYQENQEHIRARIKANYDSVASAEYGRWYRFVYSEKKSEMDRRWRAANIERALATSAARRKAKPDESRRVVADWKKRNPDRVNAINASRRAIKAGSYGKHTTKEMAEIMLRQNGRCASPWCQVILTRTNKHKDHRIPLKLGGSNDKSNMQWLCIPCNLAKSASHPVDFAQRHGYLL